MVGGWWYCGFVCGVGVGVGGVGGCVVLILMLVVFWCCKLVNCNICLVLCEFDFSNLVKISFPTRPTRETRLTDPSDHLTDPPARTYQRTVSGRIICEFIFYGRTTDLPKTRPARPEPTPT